ncbi:MAG TPA: glutathione peroxidase [Cyclobacteriaceae bacterium]|nr:glutathione peroxidase [Cyclobacteriaceae bacterium]
MEDNIYNFEANLADGRVKKLSEYSGQVILIVNTASKCGFTPQYKGLQHLFDKLNNKGFVILGFPCNQFGGQEPGSGKDILEFCRNEYDITFPIFGKIEVNGKDTNPLFVYLKKKARGMLGIKRIPWNFTKFLVSREGKVIRRFGPAATPESITPFIEKLL